MPEGHLLHHYARVHAALLRGPLAVSSPQGRFPDATLLDGEELDNTEAYGKHLFYWWASGRVLHVHLGQQGLFLRHEPPVPAPRPQVRLRMAAAAGAVDLIAPARCEIITPADRHRLVERLGSDPLRADADVEYVRRRLAASRAPIGAALLDQSVVAGVGNVLRSEVLNMLGVHPSRPARALDAETVGRLWELLVAVMARAAEEGRILTAAPADADARAAVPEQEGRFVYRQPTCRRCGTPVCEGTVGGRTAYACPVCQPERPQSGGARS